MTHKQKLDFDFYFKVFIGVAITFFGWLGARTADKFDTIQTNIESLKETQASFKTDIEWIKKTLQNEKRD